MIYLTLEIYFVLLVSVYWILLFGWIKTYFSKPILHQIKPNTRVSILVAARNEEKVILSCLESLNALQYPEKQLEILIGDDDSTDNTASIIADFIKDKPHFKLVKIIPEKYSKGKANVLAQLIKHSNSEHIMVTDADVQVNKNWVNEMLKHVDAKTCIVTGYTHVKSTGFWNSFQSLDWAFAQGIMYVFFEADQAITAMGNNMLITRKAYNEVGGYENLPFSITEDYALFEAVSQKGYDCLQVTNSNVKASTIAIDGFMNLLQQRQRWIKGSFGKLSWLLSLLFMLQILFLPMFIYEMIFKDWEFALYAFSTKTVMQSLFIYLVYRKVNEKFLWKNILLFDWYYFITSVSVVMYSILNPKTIWKGRTY